MRYGGVVVLVMLLGGGSARADEQMAPPLPDGLVLGTVEYKLPDEFHRLRVFSPERPGVERAFLGPMTLRGRGYRIEFEDQRLSRVVAITKRGPGETLFDDVWVEPGQPPSGQKPPFGLRVYYRASTDDRRQTCRDRVVGAELRVAGKLVALTPSPRNWLGLCGEQDDELWIPYRAINLPPGTYDAEVRLVERGRPKHASAWQPVTLVMPPTRLVRFAVPRLETNAWSVSLGDVAKAVLTAGISTLGDGGCTGPWVRVSIGRTPIYSTTACGFHDGWKGKSEWLRVEDADVMSIAVYLRKGNGESRFVCGFEMTAAELAAYAAAPKDLVATRGDVVRTVLRLDGSEVRDGTAPVPIDPPAKRPPRR